MGRGLEALLGQMSQAAGSRARTAGAAAPPPPAKLPGDELANLPLDLLQRGKYQPRVDMRQESLEELAASIKAQGIIQPIVVRPSMAPRPASRSATKSSPANAAGAPRRSPASPPCPPSSAACPTKPPSRWRSSRTSSARTSIRSKKRARSSGSSASSASRTSRRPMPWAVRAPRCRTCCACWSSPDEITAFVERRELEMGHARALLGLTQRRQQIEVGTLVAKKGLSVRETEALVRAHAREGRGRQRAEGQQGRSIRTCSACRTSCRKNSARRCRSSTPAPARARSSSATTR